MAYSLDARAHSEVGLVRRNNQDSAYVSPTALVVADGMGGAAAGDLASAIAIHEVARADRHLEGDEMLVAFTGAVAQANDLIADLVEEEPALDGMGTTVCGAFFSGDQLGMVHIGDSRAYLYRDGRLTRLSHDHSWVQSLVDEGRLHEDDMATHPHRSLLLRVLNGQASNAPDTEVIDLQLDDRLLFCSDGLSGFTTDAELARILAEPNLDEVVPQLIQTAHDGGGADNITFVVADVVPRSDELDAREPCQLGAVVDPELTEILAMATRSALPAASARPAGLAPGAGDHADADDMPPADALSDEDDENEDTAHDLALPTARPASSADASSGSHAAGHQASEPDAEQLRYQPTRHRRRWLPTLALAASVVLVIGAAGLGGLLYSRSQYYVGAAPTTNGESVAIFRGLPDSVLGLKLNNVQQVENTLVSDLPSYYRQQVQNTISADNFSAAQQTAGQLDSLARACNALRASAVQPASPSASTSAKPSATAKPSASTRASASASHAPASSKPTPGHSASSHASASASSAGPSSTASASPSASSTASAASPSPSSSASGIPTTGLTLQDCS